MLSWNSPQQDVIYHFPQFPQQLAFQKPTWHNMKANDTSSPSSEIFKFYIYEGRELLQAVLKWHGNLQGPVYFYGR